MNLNQGYKYEISKTLLFILIANFIIFSIKAESVHNAKVVSKVGDVPEVEAIPAPVIEDGKKKPNKIKDDSVPPESSEMDLIKTEKNFVDKNCRIIKGKVQCKNKKIKRKTIDSM